MTNGRSTHRKPLQFVVLGLCLIVGACNRAELRLPGASLDFPETRTGYVAQRTIPAVVDILPPADMRAAHYGERVAGTRWTGCRTDALWSQTASAFVQQRLQAEITASNLFLPPQSNLRPDGRFQLRSEIDAFCSQVVGLVFERAAGIVAIHFTLMKDGKVVWEKKIERVVTDADPEYTGTLVATIEQAMRVTETDSLRVVLRELLQDLDNSAVGRRNGDQT